MGRAQSKGAAVAAGLRSVSDRRPDPFAAVMGQSRGAIDFTALFAPKMTEEGVGVVALLMRDVSAGRLGPALEAVAARWSTAPDTPPAQRRLQREICRYLHDRSKAKHEPLREALNGAKPHLAVPALPDMRADLERRLADGLPSANTNHDRLVSRAESAADASVRYGLAKAAAARADIAAVVAQDCPAGDRGALHEWSVYGGLTDDKLAALLDRSDLTAALNWSLPVRPESFQTADISKSLATRLEQALAGKLQKPENKALAASVKAETKKALARHPTVLVTNLAHDLLHRNGEPSHEELAAQTGLSKAVVRKLLMRSVKGRGTYNSGRIADLSATKKFCDTLGTDWAVTHLATLCVELPQAKRQPDGRLHPKRYEQVRECVNRLSVACAPADALQTVMDHADGKVAIVGGDETWYEPYVRLVEFERSRLGL